MLRRETQPLPFIISQFSFSTGQKIYSLGLSVQSIEMVIILESPGTKESGVSWKANESGCEFGLKSDKTPEAIELAQKRGEIMIMLTLQLSAPFSNRGPFLSASGSRQWSTDRHIKLPI